MKQKQFSGLGEIVKDYQSNFAPSLAASYDDVDNYEKIVKGVHLVSKKHSFSACNPSAGKITNFVFAVGNSHQSRIDAKKLANAISILSSNGVLNGNFKDFEDIFDTISKLLVGPVFKGPCLAIYDISFRISWYINNKTGKDVRPKKFVYLFRGAYKGACSLLGVSKLNYREPRTKFGKYFPKTLNVWDIENILCIYKKNIKSIQTKPIKTTKP